jgi:hypothetical protein
MPAEPESEILFLDALMDTYWTDKAQYDAQPNNIAKRQFQDASDRRLCTLTRSHTPFKDWTGIITKIDQPNTTVLFNIDIGEGFYLDNDVSHDLSVESPAYKTISKLHVGDIVKISGEIALDGDLSTCSEIPQWQLNDPGPSDMVFHVRLTNLNGASTLAPPSSEGSTNDAPA